MDFQLFLQKAIFCKTNIMRALKILFYSIVTLVVVAFAVGRFVDSNTVEGEGPLTERNVEVSSFDKIRISGGWEVTLVPGEAYDLEINVQENLQDHVTVSIDGSTLEVGVEGHVSTDERMKIRIAAPEIAGIHLSGASVLRTENVLSGSELDLECSGASELYLEVDCDQITLDVSGASEAYLEGKANGLQVDASGAAKYYGNSCQVESADISASGASYAEVQVTESLKAEASGASKITYSGNPEQVSESSSGASTVKKK